MNKYSEQLNDAPNDLVAAHAPLVKRIAYHLLARLPSSVQLDDLIQAGMMGLLEAAKRYDASKGASFDTYAGIRIRGTMIDELRKHDWAPRSVHRNAREITQAIMKVEHETGENARGHDVAEVLGISIDDYHSRLRDTSGARMLDFEVIDGGDQNISRGMTEEILGPLEGLQSEDFRNRLISVISNLPEREQLVLSLYYEEELNLREIGGVLGVSESRISQIHSQAMLRVQARISDWR